MVNQGLCGGMCIYSLVALQPHPLTANEIELTQPAQSRSRLANSAPPGGFGFLGSTGGFSCAQAGDSTSRSENGGLKAQIGAMSFKILQNHPILYSLKGICLTLSANQAASTTRDSRDLEPRGRSDLHTSALNEYDPGPQEKHYRKHKPTHEKSTNGQQLMISAQLYPSQTQPPTGSRDRPQL